MRLTAQGVKDLNTPHKQYIPTCKEGAHIWSQPYKGWGTPNVAFDDCERWPAMVKRCQVCKTVRLIEFTS